MFAHAEPGFLGFRGLPHQRSELRRFVASVAERLLLGQSAAAPGVSLTGFQIDLNGLLCGDLGF